MKIFLKKQILAVLIVVGVAAIMSGCTTPQQESDIPWNTPQSWEGQGPMGGMFNGGY
ncbi:hypothetical protein ACFLQY_03010 [Verrucomicrobiota bacterium]